MVREEELEQWRESSIKALIPFIVFVVFYFGFSIWTRDFSRIPMSVAFIISSATALMLNHKEKLNKKIELFASGMGNRDIMIMCLIFILSGGFAATAQAVGGVDAVVEIAHNFIPGRFMIFGLFVISALISLSVGTSCGTVAAITPIAVSVSEAFGLSPAYVLGATVGGAMFGDNMSLISDTKIAASRSLGVEIRDEMLFNLKIITIPAILCLIFYLTPMFATASDAGTVGTSALTPQHLVKALPYLLLLIFGISGINVMFLLFFGMILNTIIGITFGMFNIFDAFTYIGNGTLNMAPALIVAMFAGGLLMLVKYNGGISYIINKTGNFIKNKRSCEVGICLLVGIINFFTANNTVAIITSGSIAKELAIKNNLKPERAASLLDTTSCIVQGFLPYGAQIIIAVGLASAIKASSFTVIEGLFYPAFMLLGLIWSISRTKNS